MPFQLVEGIVSLRSAKAQFNVLQRPVLWYMHISLYLRGQMKGPVLRLSPPGRGSGLRAQSGNAWHIQVLIFTPCLNSNLQCVSLPDDIGMLYVGATTGERG